jgi:hypothetical protein
VSPSNGDNSAILWMVVAVKIAVADNVEVINKNGLFNDDTKPYSLVVSAGVAVIMRPIDDKSHSTRI